MSRRLPGTRVAYSNLGISQKKRKKKMKISDGWWIVIAAVIVIALTAGFITLLNKAEDSSRADAEIREQVRRASIPLEGKTDRDFSVAFILRGGPFGDTELETVVADIKIGYNPETDVYTWGLPVEKHPAFLEAFARWDSAFASAQSNAALLSPSGKLLPTVVNVTREGITGDQVPVVLGEKEGKPDVENVSHEVIYKMNFGGDNGAGYTTSVVDNGEYFYVTYDAPQTETGRSRLQTIVLKDLVYKAVIAPFLAPEEFTIGTPQIVSPEVSGESGDVLVNLLNSIGNRGGTEKIAEIVLYPRDTRSLEIENELISALLFNIDQQSAKRGQPVMVSIVGFKDEYTVMKGFLQGDGGGARGSINGKLFGGGLMLWGLGGGLIDGGLDGQFSQDPVSLNGSVSNIPIQEIRIYIYLENP